MASAFGKAFDLLDPELQRTICRNLVTRRKRYTRAMVGEKTRPAVILLGDTPGPGRPTDPNYHHTPFYSTKHSSLWLNKQLAELQIDEEKLIWFNTTLADGMPLDSRLYSKQLTEKPMVICLGNNAEKWLLQRFTYGPLHAKVHHPQAWKRFHSGKPYPLLALLQQALDL